MEEVTIVNAWAVVRKDGKIQHLDGGLAKRLAVFGTKEDADRDCDKKDEVVSPVEIRIYPKLKTKTTYGWSADPQTDRELQRKYGDSIHKPKEE